MTPDGELLCCYAENRSEEAFAELVRRHLDLVYSAALRQVNGDSHLAQDVTQTVFTDLARKAASLARRPSLTGWLYTSAHFAAANAVRTGRRRQVREQEAHAMRELLNDSEANLDWDRLRPVLDQVMHELKESDREAILMRYFEKRQLADIGEKLDLSENAARMRVERALDKLRELLARRGVTSTTAALAAVLPGQAVAAAPAALAAGITTTAIAGAAAGGGTSLTILKLMSMTKVKAGIVGAIVIAGVGTSVLVQQQANAKLRPANESLRRQEDQIAELQQANGRLAAVAAQPQGAALNTAEDLSRLREEADALRQQTNELAKLRQQNRQLQTAMTQTTPVPAAGTLSAMLQAREDTKARMLYGSAWALALREYAAQNQDHLPADLSEAKQYLRDDSATNNSFSADQFEIVYHGLLKDANAGSRDNRLLPTILLREKKPRQLPNGEWERIYIYHGGASSYIQMADDKFDYWEKAAGINHPIQSP